MAKTQILITARDPRGVMAAINVVTEEEWVPLDIRDLDKVEDFRPSEVIHLSIAGPNKGGYAYDSDWGTAVVRK